MGKVKAFFVLSIVVPIGLLATFRLTGLLQEPSKISETDTLDVVKWESERPGGSLDIWEPVESVYTKDNLSIVYGVFIDDYQEESYYGGSDCMTLTVNVTASISDGYVENVDLILQDNYTHSRIDFFEEHQLIKTENLSIVDLKDWDKEVFINLTGANNPKSISFWAPVNWVLGSPNNQSHQLDARFELVYFNNTVYRRIIQPFRLKLAPDGFNSFDTALKVQNGTYSRLYLGGYDAKDFFEIHLIQGQRIDVHVSPMSLDVTPDFDMYLYDPTGNLRASPTDQRDYYKKISYVADIAGGWYIETRAYENHGFYSITVEIN